MFTLGTFLNFASLALRSLATPLAEQPVKCVQGIVVVVCHGNNSDYHNPHRTSPRSADIQYLSQIGENVAGAFGNDSYLQYVPNEDTASDYETSSGNGIGKFHQMIKSYVDQCKHKVDPKMVVIGSGQGANVISDALVGAGGHESLDAYKESIVGGALFADPSWVPGYHPYDAGNATRGGVGVKTHKQMKYLNKNYGHKIHSWCRSGDKFCDCQKGSDSMKIHDEEQVTYGPEAMQFLKSVLKKYT